MAGQLLYIIIALLILNVIIVFHEFGHYLVGRLCGIGIIEFSVGFGPKLLGKRIGEIDYSLRAIPMGGYCKFVGEDEDNTAPNAMNNASVFKRIATVAAGPIMNFIVAYIAAVIMMSVMGIGTSLPVVYSVVEDMPAAQAGLMAGDRFIEVNGETVPNDGSGVALMQDAISSGEAINLIVDRAGEQVSLTVTPQIVFDEQLQTERNQIGITFDFKPFTFGKILTYSGQYMVACTKEMFDILRSLFFRFEGAENVSGVVGTVAVISDVVQTDAKLIWNILFIISLNLGIMNLLPFPALDGGRLVFLFVEAVRGKPVPPDKEGMVHAIGLVLLLSLGMALIWKDAVALIFR